MEGNLNDEILKLDTFKEYLNAFKQTSEYKKLTESKTYRDSKDEDKISLERTYFISYAQKIEKDKLLYFSLSLNQEVLIIKAPSDIKEQKRFLGYEWSNRKGDEGLKELSNPYESPLFERDNPHNDFKLNTLIRKSFDNTLDSIPQELQPYATQARLIDMIDFSKVEFNKAISLNPHSNDSHSVQSNPFANSKYELVKLGEVCNILIGGTPSRSNPDYFKGNNLWVSIAEMNGQIILDTKEKITDEAIKKSNVKLIPKNTTLLSFKLSIGKTAIAGKDLYTNEAIAGLIPIHKEKILDKYLLYFFQSKILNLNLIRGNNAFGKSLNSTILKENIKIPLPPLEIQTQIVTECEGLESQCNTIEQSIKAYQELIKAILWHCGITTESTKDFDSILMSLAELESKLDFELLGKTKQDSKAFLQNLTNTLNTLPTPPSNGWERIWLKDTRFIDLNPKKEINNYDENMLVSFVEMASVSDKGYIERKINKPLKEVKKGYTYFIENDVLIAKITPCMENGKCAIATNLTNNIGFGSTEFHIFRAKSGLKPNFLFYNLNQEAIREQAAIAMTGASGHKRVPISFYENLTIPLPPLEIQTKITQSIETIQSQISFFRFCTSAFTISKTRGIEKILF